jgi:cyclophilin family peptidyl-prolyl cis-trans isomerase
MKKLLLLTLTILSISFLGSAQTKKPATAKKPAPKHTTVTQPKVKKPKGQRVEITTEFGVMIVLLYDATPFHRDNFIKLVKQGFYDSLMFHRVIKSFMIQGGDPTSKNADSLSSLGSGDVGYKIPAEFNPNLYHKRGALAAARDNNPQQMSSGCQFYIVQGKTYTVQELEQIINSRNMSRKQELLYTMYQSDTVQAAINALQNLGDKEQVRQYMEKLQVVADAAYKTKYPNAEKVNNDIILTYNQFGGTPHLDGAYTVFGELQSGWEVLDKIASTPVRASDNRPMNDLRMKMRVLK